MANVRWVTAKKWLFSLLADITENLNLSNILVSAIILFNYSIFGKQDLKQGRISFK
jgi:hypothetical protein